MKLDYADGTYLITSDSGYGGYYAGRVLCSDGKVRSLKRIAISPDTFFSIPASVTVNGKTVTGYVTSDHSPTESGKETVFFVANQYGKNANLLPRGKYVKCDNCADGILLKACH